MWYNVFTIFYSEIRGKSQMKKKIFTLFLSLYCTLVISSCTEKEKPESSTKTETTTAQTTIISLSDSEKENARTCVKELYDAACEVADIYSTAGATIMADVITNSDADGSDSEKINICRKVINRFDKDGIWAFKIERFKIISVVYAPFENCGFVARYPSEFAGDTQTVNQNNISDYLE